MNCNIAVIYHIKSLRLAKKSAPPSGPNPKKNLKKTLYVEQVLVCMHIQNFDKCSIHTQEASEAVFAPET